MGKRNITQQETTSKFSPKFCCFHDKERLCQYDLIATTFITVFLNQLYLISKKTVQNTLKTSHWIMSVNQN